MKKFLLTVVVILLLQTVRAIEAQDILSGSTLNIEQLASEYQKILNEVGNSEHADDYEKALHAVFSKLNEMQEKPTDVNPPSIEWLNSAENAPSDSLKICIVVSRFRHMIEYHEIGTFYHTLAEYLASRGHKVTIAVPSDEKISPWINFYKNKGIELISVPSVSGIKLTMPIPQKRSYEAYMYLKKLRFDVVHFPEHEGIGYYSLLAKKDNLALSASVLVVGMHSPSRWMMQNNKPLDADHIPSVEFLEVDFMERRSVELADVIMTSSNAMIRWAASQGWKVPSTVYMLPFLPGNEVTSLPTYPQPSPSPNELVFYGELEARKGLGLFCDSIDRLMKDGVITTTSDVKLTFMGTLAGNETGIDSVEYITTRAKSWSIQPNVITNKNRMESLEYFISGRRLAVMSSSVDGDAQQQVYDCLFSGIPFIASNLESTQDLIADEDESRVLFEPDVKHLSEKMMKSLGAELTSVKKEISVQQIEEIWDTFYSAISQNKKVEMNQPTAITNPLVSICVVHYNRPELLRQLLDSIEKQDYQNFEIILVDDGSDTPSAQALMDQIEATPSAFSSRPLTLIRTENRYLGAARNTAARRAQGKYILFMDDDNYCKPNQISTYVRVAEHTGAQQLTSGHDIFKGINPPSEFDVDSRWIPLGQAVTVGVFKNCFGDANFFVQREAFLEIGGFTEETNLGYEDYEFHVKFALNGYRLEVIPEPLLWYRMHDFQGQMLFATDVVQGYMRALRPYSALLQNPEDLLKVVAGRSVLDPKPECNETLTSVTPRIIYINEPTNLTINGMGFMCTNPVIAVEIDGEPCEQFFVVNDTQLICEAPNLSQRAQATIVIKFEDGTLLSESILSYLDASGPTFKSAKMKDNGVIVIEFTSPTDKGEPAEIETPCHVLDDDTLETYAVIGCSWLTNQTLLIFNHQLRPNSPITLREDVLYAVPFIQGSTPGSGSAVIEPPSNPIRPALSLQYSPTASLCQDYTIDASASTAGIGSLLEIEWIVSDCMLGAVSCMSQDGIVALTDELEANNNTVVTFTPPDLSNNYELKVLVTVTNLAGASSSQTIAIQFKTDRALGVTILGPSALTLEPAKALTLYPNVSLQDCSGPAATDGFRYDWKLDGTTISHTRECVVPAYTFEPGKTYAITCSVNAIDSSGGSIVVTDTGSATVQVTAQYAALVPKIAGGSKRTLGTTQTLELDGSKSSDPSFSDGGKDGITFAWTCTYSGGNCDASLTNPTTAKPSFSNSVEGSYTITMTITSGVRSASASTVINVINGNPPVFGLMGDVPAVHNPANKLVLTASLDPQSYGMKVSYLWTVTGQFTRSPFSKNFKTPLNTKHLVVREGAMLEGQEYTITLTVTNTNTNTSADASFTITTGITPYSTAGLNNITVDTSSYSTFKDSVKIRVNKWNTNAAPLTYSFHSVRGNERAQLSEPTTSNNIDVKYLAPGPITFYCTITDSVGMTAVTSVSAVIPSTTIDTTTAMSSLLSQAESGEVDSKTFASAVVNVVNAATSQNASSEAVFNLKKEAFMKLYSIINAAGASEWTVNNMRAWLDMLINLIKSTVPNLDTEILAVVIDILESISDQITTKIIVGTLSPSSDTSFPTDAVSALGAISQHLALQKSYQLDRAMLSQFESVKAALTSSLLKLVVPEEEAIEISAPGMSGTLLVRDSSSYAGGSFELPTGAGVTFPASILNATGDGDVGLVIMVFTSNTFNTTTKEGGTVIGGITSIDLVDANGNPIDVDNLDPPLDVFIPATGLTPSGNQGCIFLNDEDPLNTFWAYDGCEYVGMTDDESAFHCQCTHLTAFAVSEEEVAPDPTDDVEGGLLSESGFSTTNIIIIVVVVVGALLIVGGIVAFIVIRRRKRNADKVVTYDDQQNAEKQPAKEPSPRKPEDKKEAWPEPPKELTTAESQEKSAEESAAVKIQSVYRGYNVRKEVKQLRKEKSEQDLKAREEEEEKRREEQRKEEERQEEERRKEEERRRKEKEEERKKQEEEEKKQEEEEKKEEEEEKKEEEEEEKKPTKKKGSKKKGKKGKKKEPKEGDYDPAKEAAARKIQAAYRRHLARADLQREKEIEAILVDIDDLLALEM